MDVQPGSALNPLSSGPLRRRAVPPDPKKKTDVDSRSCSGTNPVCVQLFPVQNHSRLYLTGQQSADCENMRRRLRPRLTSFVRQKKQAKTQEKHNRQNGQNPFDTGNESHSGFSIQTPQFWPTLLTKQHGLIWGGKGLLGPHCSPLIRACLHEWKTAHKSVDLLLAPLPSVYLINILSPSSVSVLDSVCPFLFPIVFASKQYYLW